MISIVDQWTACKCVNPVLIPKSFKHNWVQLRLEYTVLNFIVFMGMHSKFFKLFTLDHFKTLWCYFILVFFSIIICIGSKTSKFYFACSDCTFRVNDNSNCWILHQLHCLLSININTRKPASIARMWMIPTANEFWSVNLSRLFLMVDLIGCTFLCCIYSCFSSNNWKCKYIHNIHSVTNWETL